MMSVPFSLNHNRGDQAQSLADLSYKLFSTEGEKSRRNQQQMCF